jgi:hypothetical protein
LNTLSSVYHKHNPKENVEEDPFLKSLLNAVFHLHRQGCTLFLEAQINQNLITNHFIQSNLSTLSSVYHKHNPKENVEEDPFLTTKSKCGWIFLKINKK